jgi:hypothetical protein
MKALTLAWASSAAMALAAVAGGCSRNNESGPASSSWTCATDGTTGGCSCQTGPASGESSDATAVSTCSAASVNGVCQTDSVIGPNGIEPTCYCVPIWCGTGAGGDCFCGQDSTNGTASSCPIPSGGVCCNFASGCYCTTGSCLSGDTEVPSCDVTELQTSFDDGIQIVSDCSSPPPSASSSSSSSGSSGSGSSSGGSSSGCISGGSVCQPGDDCCSDTLNDITRVCCGSKAPYSCEPTSGVGACSTVAGSSGGTCRGSGSNCTDGSECCSGSCNTVSGTANYDTCN